jgi:hypothetical protein
MKQKQAVHRSGADQPVLQFLSNRRAEVVRYARVQGFKSNANLHLITSWFGRSFANNIHVDYQPRWAIV